MPPTPKNPRSKRRRSSADAADAPAATPTKKASPSAASARKTKAMPAANDHDPEEPPSTPPPTQSDLDLDVELEKDPDGGIRLGGLYIPPPPPPALTFDNDRPRLVITHIENENFKSYAGLQTLGPFHKSFTSIVGPNGSGKSNVIDSMLFVFGYRAQQIRSKKISVLIHSSDKFPDLRSCVVRVFFQEIIDDGKEESAGGIAVPDSQFCVSRTAFKDSTSFYEVNGKRCLFKEVSALLKRKGVDLDHNRFLILQGEVEQIAQMKPKGANSNDTGMLEFLEDIIGSSRFQEPIELLKKTVTELDELRGEKLSRVKLVEKEKDELEGPRNKAIEYLRQENQITEKKNIGYQQYIHECTKKIEEVESARQEYEKGAASIISQVQKILEERTEMEKTQTEVSQNLESVRGKLDEAQEKFKKHELEDAKLREEMKNINTKRKKVLHLAKMEKEKLEQLLSVPESNKAKIEECNELEVKLVDKREEEQKNYDEALNKINKETKGYQEEKETFETKLIELRKEVNEKESDLKVVETELSMINSNEEKEKCRLEQLIITKDKSASDLTKNQTRKKELEKMVPETQAKVATLKTELQELGQKEDKLSANVKRLQGQFEEKRSNMNAHKTRGKVIEALMEQKRCGQIPGVFGRLGDLGAIDKKYDVAISTAYGSALDTILVDTVDTAKNCIEYIKRNNIGRGNFLALDKTLDYTQKARSKIQTPENVSRLYDLVTPQDPKYATAFYKYMGDCLVATSLEQAQRIAYGAVRYRVVTLTGEVIETSGSMAGGGNVVARGKMGTELREEHDDRSIQSMENELGVAKRDYQECLQERTEKENSLQKFSRDYDSFSKELERLVMDIKMLQERHQSSDQQIKKQEKLVAAAKADPAQLRELEEKMAEKAEKLEKAKEKSGTVEEAVKKLNGKIKEIMGNRLKAISKKLEEVKAQLEKVKKEKTRLEVGIKSSDRDVKKSKDKLTDYETEVTEAEEKMRAMKENRDALEAEGMSVIKNLDELKKKEEEATHNFEKINAKIESMKKVEAKVKSQEIEINQAREKYDNEIRDQTKNQAHWKREVKKLKLREIPGEEVPELKTYDEEALTEVDMKKWQYELNLMEEKMATLKVNQAVIEEYRVKEAIYLERVAELEEISGRKEKQRKNHEELRKLRLNEFMEGFSIITAKLKEMYQMITLGGDAELELVDSLDPFTEGIVFSVRPPNKSWKNISNLSGGEKTLSSLALVFALHFYKPTPLYVMDEIDAALDFKNVSIVANYIRERTKNAQFIIISLRSNMFELADRLVGIYKTYNCTKSVTINPQLLSNKI